MNYSFRRAVAFLPAAVLGLALGLAVNAWRHRRAVETSPPPAASPPSQTASQPQAAPEPDETTELPIDDAAEFVRRFSGGRNPSPLRSRLDRETLVASLTPDAFLAMVRDGVAPPALWESEALRERFRVWAGADRQSFLDIALQLPETASRVCLDAAFKGLTADECRAFMTGWAGLSPHMREMLFQKAAAAVARTDPAGALALLDELPLSERERDSVTTSTFAALLDGLKEKPAEWSRMFQLILDTAQEQPADRMHRFIGDALRGIPAGRAAEAWPVIRDAGMEAPIQREFLGNWAHSDPDAALAMTVEQFPSANADWETQRLYENLATRSAVHLQLLDENNNRDPAAWLALAENVPPGSGRDAFMAGLTSQAASGNPALAAQLLPHVSEEHRAQTINMIAELWTARDAVAASEWVFSLPAGAERDRAVGGFARRLAESDPERAAQWAVTIQDDSSRRSALQKVHQTWQRLDAAAAAHWLQSESRLTPQDHAALETSRP